MDIFISYERSDRDRVAGIAEALETQGWSVWWDRKLIGGEHFDHVIQKELDTAKCVIVVWSRTSIESDWVKDEAAEGLKRDILIPIRIDDVSPPLGFRRLHTIDLLTLHHATKAPAQFNELLESARHVIQNPESSKATPPAGPNVKPPGMPVRSNARRIVLAAVALLILGAAIVRMIDFNRGGTPSGSSPTEAAQPSPAPSPAEPVRSADDNVAADAPAKQPATPVRSTCTVSLAAPAANATLPQRRLEDGKVESVWQFAWRDCPEASRYHLYVIGPSALNPLIDLDTLTAATYQHRSNREITRAEGWSWKVRAYADGQWGEWSEERKFDVGLAPKADTGDTQVIRSAVDKVSRGKWISEGPGLAVFEVPYTFDRAHTRPMYVRVIIYGEADKADTGPKPRRPVIGTGQARLSAPSGTVRVDVRKTLGTAARSSFVEAALLEERIPLNVQQWPETRLWGP